MRGSGALIPVPYSPRSLFKEARRLYRVPKRVGKKRDCAEGTRKGEEDGEKGERHWQSRVCQNKKRQTGGYCHEAEKRSKTDGAPGKRASEAREVGVQAEAAYVQGAVGSRDRAGS